MNRYPTPLPPVRKRHLAREYLGTFRIYFFGTLGVLLALAALVFGFGIVQALRQ